jgi:hypothetical protein
VLALPVLLILLRVIKEVHLYFPVLRRLVVVTEAFLLMAGMAVLAVEALLLLLTPEARRLRDKVTLAGMDLRIT